MSAIPQPAARGQELLELHSGDRMTQPEFHRIYSQMPEDFKAELIAGTVFVASPLRRKHGTNHLPLGSLFFAYEGHTPGVESADNTTTILSDDSEPQPDLFLRVLPEYGGQSLTTEDDYVEGAPELVAEIAHASRSIDLNLKREVYSRHGVLEYLVLTLNEQRLRWFDLRSNEELLADPDGVIRLRTFPGFWIDVAALFAKDYGRLMATLQAGPATPEHAAFVATLAAAKKGS